MLNGKPTDGEIEQTIRLAIADVLRRRGHEVPPFDEDALLVATGLTSLDLAALIARLEQRWKVDPFLEAVPITEVRTVADLCRAYRDFINNT
jgi:acyl carrier protein